MLREPRKIVALKRGSQSQLSGFWGPFTPGPCRLVSGGGGGERDSWDQVLNSNHSLSLTVLRPQGSSRGCVIHPKTKPAPPGTFLPSSPLSQSLSFSCSVEVPVQASRARMSLRHAGLSWHRGRSWNREGRGRLKPWKSGYSPGGIVPWPLLLGTAYLTE